MGQSWLPYTRINGSTLPASDPAMALVAPIPGQPGYSTRLVEFVRASVPDVWQGRSVRFQTSLLGSVTCEAAYPDGGCQADQIPLMSLDVWGLPTSAPVADPANPNFVYQRFERGVLLYDGTSGTTQWLLMGDALKSLLTGVNLPGDLAAQASGSPLLLQYDPNQLHGLARPDALPNTDLTNAFTPLPAS
jgi:hypothetical protein